MANIKAPIDVINIPSASVALNTETVLSGILNYINTTSALKATINNPTFTGTLLVPNVAVGVSGSQIANTYTVNLNIFAASYGLSSTKTSGPTIFQSTITPSGGSDGDIWMQYS